MNALSPKAAWELWRAGFKGLDTLDLSRALTFAAGQGWVRGELVLSVSSDEPNANDVLRARKLFIELKSSFPSGMTAAEVAEVRAAIASAPPSWRTRAEHSNLMINLPREGAA